MPESNPWKKVSFAHRERDRREAGGIGTLALAIVLGGVLAAVAGGVVGYAIFGEVNYPLRSDKLDFQAMTLSELNETNLWMYVLVGAVVGAGSAIWAIVKFWRGK
jgi:hypothetical protein